MSVETSTKKRNSRTVFEVSLGPVCPVKAFDDDRVELHVDTVMTRPAHEPSVWLDAHFIEAKKNQEIKVSNKRSWGRRVLK